MTMRLGFHGSRTLSDERVRIIILEAIEKYKPDCIVTHGEPEGVCGLVRKICQENAIPLTLHFLNFRKLRGAFEWRSKAVAGDSDHAIIIWDGESKGTSNEQKLLTKMGKTFDLYQLEKPKHAVSNGFDPEGEWGGLDQFPDIEL